VLSQGFIRKSGQRVTRGGELALLLEWPGLNRGRLDAILKQHGLSF
jgi:hypothetical protein